MNHQNVEVRFAIDENQLKHDLTDISTKLPDKMVESAVTI